MKILISITDKSLNETVIINVAYCFLSTNGRLIFTIGKNDLSQEFDESIKKYEKKRSEDVGIVTIELKKTIKSHGIICDIFSDTVFYSFYL